VPYVTRFDVSVIQGLISFLAPYTFKYPVAPMGSDA